MIELLNGEAWRRMQALQQSAGVMSFKISGEITGVETIAQGSSIRCLSRLQKAYGIGNWMKKKGFATVVFADGVSTRAEVHWYEAHGIGKMEMKIKDFI